MSEMIRVTLPDGSAREVPSGTTPADIAAAIGPGLAKAALAARVDGEVRDISRPLVADTQLALITSKDEAEALELVRHDYAHILAEAVQKLFPGTQITFGPATDDGFYYDVMAPASRGPFTLDDLPLIEEKMREIIRADKPLRREVAAGHAPQQQAAYRLRITQGKRQRHAAAGRTAAHKCRQRIELFQ